MAVNKRDLSIPGFETGWPVVNYAQEQRNFQTVFNGRQEPMSIPRFKFTYLVEFKLNPRIQENPITNIQEFVTNGKIYTQLKRIDHPKPEIKYETLRSYNKWIKVPTVMEFLAASMTFDDDSTAVTQALWKEYMNFYSHLATVGENIGAGATSNLSSSSASGEYQYTERLVGEDMRAGMNRRPSLGMRLKANDMRHFFESIVIYDLGTEPDAVNVYWFHNPVITSWDHDNLDEEDRTNKVEVTANFEYESYYWTFGQNRGRLRDYITNILGFFPSQATSERRKNGVGRQNLSRNQSRAVSTVDSVANVFATNPALGDLLSDLPEVIRQSNELQNGNRFPTESEQELEDLNDLGVEVFPLPDNPLQPPTPISEPILPQQAEPTVPTSISGKEAELRQVEQEQQALINAGPVDPNTPQGRTALRRQAQLEEKREQLTEALVQQRSQQRATDLQNPSTQSALANTQSRLGGAPSAPSPVIPNPQAQQVVNSAVNAVNRTQIQIDGLNSQIAALQQERNEAVSRGDNSTAQNINATIAQQAGRVDQLERQLDTLKGVAEDVGGDID